MNSSDWIHIHSLSLQCIVGVHEFEKQAPREIIIQLSLNTSLHRAGRSDNLEHSVDYSVVCDNVARFVETSHFELIESLAEGIATLCLKNEKVTTVRVSVEKPGAVPKAQSVSVEITRTRHP
jgi:FolB domain-containing protein